MAERKNKSDTAGDVAVVKKYANRRLYNTASSSYVTLDDLTRMVRNGEHFIVYDAKTSEDLTRSILTQIILEEDGKGRNLLPINFLRHLIGFYDDNMRAFLPRYLEMSIQNFSDNQEQIKDYIEGTFDKFFPMSQFEDMTKRNIALFQQAASMFNPSIARANGVHPGQGEDAPSKAAAKDEIEDVANQIEALQQKLADLKAAQKSPSPD